MSLFELFTWLAIAVLIVGSLVVFGWFLVDLARTSRASPGRSTRRNGEE